MINQMSFTGRETMLTQSVEKVVSKAHEYIGASKIFDNAESLVKETAKNIVNNRNTVEYSNQAAASFAISHGTPKEALPEAVARCLDITI